MSSRTYLREYQFFLSDTLPQLDEELAGLRNQGLLLTHELKVGVPERDDWHRASEQARQALTDDPRELVEGLDYEVDRLTDQSYVLKDNSNGHERAVAMFLQEGESFDRKQDRFVNKSPVAYALNEADKRNLDYVIGSSGDTLRLYTTNPEVTDPVLKSRDIAREVDPVARTVRKRLNELAGDGVVVRKSVGSGTV